MRVVKMKTICGIASKYDQLQVNIWLCAWLSSNWSQAAQENGCVTANRNSMTQFHASFSVAKSIQTNVFYHISWLPMPVSRTLTSRWMHDTTLEPKTLYCHQYPSMLMRGAIMLHCNAHCPGYSVLHALKGIEPFPTHPRSVTICI